MMVPTPTRRSIRYFPSREGSHREGHAFLLARDIPLGIMPIRGVRDRASFKLELTPPDDERAKWLTHFLHVGRLERRSLDEAVRQFVETTAHYLGYNGEMHLEILSDEQDQPLRLDPLPPGRVIRAPRSFLQVIPKPDRDRFEGRRFARIPRDQMWHIALPSPLGTPRAHRRLLSRLEALSNPMPGFVFKTRDLGRSKGYDFSAHRQACDLAQEKATHRWGTVPSLQQIKGSTEYFFIARRLAFLKAQATLREHLIRELNELLAYLGISHSVVVSGIPTADEIERILRRLHASEISFGDALDSARI